MGSRGMYLHESVHFSCAGAPGLASWGGGSWSRGHGARSLPCWAAAAAVACSCLGGPGANPGSKAQLVLCSLASGTGSGIAALPCPGDHSLGDEPGAVSSGPPGPEALPSGPQSQRKQSRSLLTAPALTLGLPIEAGLQLYHSHVLSRVLTLRCCHGDKADLPWE